MNLQNGILFLKVEVLKKPVIKIGKYQVIPSLRQVRKRKGNSK